MRTVVMHSFGVCGLCLLVALSVWQYVRLGEKQVILAEHAAVATEIAAPIQDVVPAHDVTEIPRSLFRRVAVTGRYVEESQRYVFSIGADRNAGRGPGYRVMTLLRVAPPAHGDASGIQHSFGVTAQERGKASPHRVRNLDRSGLCG